MNYASRNVNAIPAISLAEEADFSLGALRVCPSARQVRLGDRTETLEPRVMQVLVVLARAAGAVVSREQLIDRCWGGRVVGDDAVSNTIVKVRALSGLSAQPSFEIETIPRVGYRLRQLHRDVANAIPESAVSPSVRWNFRSWRSLGLGLIVAAAAIAAGLIAARYFYPGRGPEWTVAESHLPLFSAAEIEVYPAIAPDGTMVAYSAGPTRNSRHIYLRLMRGGDPIQLTHDAFDASAPAWSPDGNTIAYVLSEEGHPCRIMEIAVPAGQSRQIGKCRISERSQLAFDPSRRALYYVDAPAHGTTDRIFKLDLDSGHVSPVTRPALPAIDSSPEISPAGDALLYTRYPAANRIEIHILALPNGVDRLVGAFDGGDVNATWSTDGHTIFLARSQGSDNALWAYPAHGGEPSRIVSTGEYLGRLSAGPNGLLAMEMAYPGGQLVAVTPHSDLPPKPIQSGGLRTWCVDFASDGTFLATGWRVDKWGVWVSAPNESPHELLSLDDSACAIRWSPDGARFAFIGWWRAHGFQVRVFKRDGEPIAQFRFPGNDTGVLDWSADGKSILTCRKEAKGWRIWRTDLATPDKSVPITPYGWRDPRVHGTMLFAEKDGVPGIWRIDGTPHRMTDGPSSIATDVYNIAGDRLIYSDTADPEHPMFSAVSVNGGPKDRLAPLPNGQGGFTFGVDPKSGDIVYTQETDESDIGLLRLEKR